MFAESSLALGSGAGLAQLGVVGTVHPTVSPGDESPVVSTRFSRKMAFPCPEKAWFTLTHSHSASHRSHAPRLMMTQTSTNFDYRNAVYTHFHWRHLGTLSLTLPSNAATRPPAARRLSRTYR
jgi:hypothetical protein